ncbi:DEAD box polypeptide 27 [Aphelenchoides besseyi]|nr:DEAD box polypeptide 27 [Aphelenchoides besseyi]
MAHSFKPIPILPNDGKHATISDVSDYWSRMKELTVFEEPGIVTSVRFTPNAPHHLAATSAKRASFLDTSISQPIWLHNRFKSSVHGLQFRRDGRFMGLGSEDGYVHFFDLQQNNLPSRHSLRVFQAHNCEVRTLAFTSALNQCATFGDDGDIKVWDLAVSHSTVPLWHGKNVHEDRIRAAVASKNQDVIVSGSYDHTIKLWDTKQDPNEGPVISLKHGHPIESLLLHPNNRILISAGGNLVKLWDIASGGGKLLKTLENHARTVTSVCFSTKQRFLLSGGLDRRIHVYQIDQGHFELIHSIKTAAPVLSLDVAPNDECMAFGMNNLLSVHRRHPKQHAHAATNDSKTILIGDGQRKRKGTANTVYHKERGGEAVKMDITASTRHADQIRLGKLDKLLRSYQYRKIVDQLFGTEKLHEERSTVVVATLERLRIAKALNIGFSGRHGKELSNILSFLSQNLFCPAYFPVLYEVTHAVLDLYAEEKLSNQEVVALRTLHSHISDELACEQTFAESTGSLETLMALWNEERRKNGKITTDRNFLGDVLLTPKLFALEDMFYPRTIADEEEIVEEELSSESEDEALTARKRKRRAINSGGFTNDFHFDDDAETENATDHMDGIQHYLKKTVASSLQEKIEQERLSHKMDKKTILGGVIETEEEAREADENEFDQLMQTSDTLREKKLKGKKTMMQKEDFFDPSSSEISTSKNEKTFYEMALSRPILKAIMECGYTNPTPIQAACIPVALAGKDICACSSTGTGKTAAFMLPILERLLYRPKQHRTVTRVLVLAPTRELAIQIFQVTRRLAQFSSIEICLCAGGLDLKAQEAALRMGLDIVIATPGRLIDHLHNSPNFSLLDVEVLVLDEADRMLEEQFVDQMKEIIRLCSKNRQTMLFSATMTDEVEDLARMSLNTPVRLFVNENTDTAANLKQEFIRIREGRETDREAIVSALVTRNFPDHVIVFVKTKQHCERMNILLGLLGVKVAQLHGGLTQSQRVQALTAFKKQEVDVLLCTDLAARGLDIEGVLTVINMHMPNSLKPYVHRVGRTARAGKAGRSISLVGEHERKLLKAIYKQNQANALKIRVVAPEVVNAYLERIGYWTESISRIQREEAEEKAARQVESVMQKAENQLNNVLDERENRVWFQDAEDKREKKRKLREAKRVEKAKLAAKQKTPEERKMENLMSFQARQAKRVKRLKKLRVVEEDDQPERNRKVGKSKARKRSSFTSELTDVNRRSLKKFRSGPDDVKFKRAKAEMKKRGTLKGPRP